MASAMRSIKKEPIVVRTEFRTSIIMMWMAALVVPSGGELRAENESHSVIRPARVITFETDEGSYMNVDLSPDGEVIVFNLLGNIYTVPVSGGRARQLTNGLDWKTGAVWSPDGKHIAYVSDAADGQKDSFWVISEDGSNPRSVKTQGVGNVEWTSDGKALVDRLINIYDLTGKQRVWHLPSSLEKKKIRGGQFSRDGRFVYVLSRREGDSAAEAQVQRYDLTTGAMTVLASLEFPCKTVVISPDGRWLAYIAEVNSWSDTPDSFGLRIRNLDSGHERWLAYPVTRYRRPVERYVFTHDSQAVIIAYGGKLHRIEIATCIDKIIPFTATVRSELGPLVYHQFRLKNGPLAVRDIRSPSISPAHKTLVFGALQRLYIMSLPAGKPSPLITEKIGSGQFQPAYSPDGKWIAYVTWSDDESGHVWRVPTAGGRPEQLTPAAAAGYFQRPTWSPDGEYIAVFQTEPSKARLGGPLNGVREGDLLILPAAGGTPRTLLQNVCRNAVATFSTDGLHILTQSGCISSGGGSELIEVRRDGHGDPQVIARIAAERRDVEPVPDSPTEAVASPDNRFIAYILRGALYLARLPTSSGASAKSEKDIPGSVVFSDTKGPGPLVKLMRHGARDLTWECNQRTGCSLMWVHASKVYSVNPERIDFAMPYAGDMERVPHEEISIELKAPRHTAHGMLALSGARVITMRGDEVLERGTILITNDRITAVGPSASIRIPKGATVLDASGTTVMPGLIDVHAHLRPPRDGFFQSQWPLRVHLAYGVTTVRDPSANTDQFGYAELIETGRLVGPRLFSVGEPAIPGSANLEGFKDAQAIVQHRKAMGAIFIKQYAQPSRRQRQWLVNAAAEAGLNITNEGGRDTLGMLRMVLDGSTGWEHGLDAEIYGDVIRFVAQAKTWYTPTLAVYGTELRDRYLEGDDTKYSRFVPRDEAMLQFPTTLDHLFAYGRHRIPVARGVAAIVHQGGHVALGSHGDFGGVGTHWELWLLQQGGLSPHEALRCATLKGAEGLGIQQDLGSIEPGKLADLVVLERDPLEKIENSLSIRYVMKNGELYDGNTLSRILPAAQ